MKTLAMNLASALFLGMLSFGAQAAEAAPFELTSNLKAGQTIPADYYANGFGCTAKSLSPELEWKNVPAGTKSFAVTFYDQDAPTGSGFWHYVLFDVPANVQKFEIGDLSSGKIPQGAVESITDAGTPGFFGPCPPVGRQHRYVYTVHALKVAKLGVAPTATPALVGFNIWMNSLGQASFGVKAGPRK